MKRSTTLLAGICVLVSWAALAADPASIGARVAARTNVGAAVQAVGADSFAGSSVTFAEGVTGFADVTYATLPGYRPLKLDLFVPAATGAAPRPLVVYIHGGGWMGGGPRRSAAYADWPAVLASLAARGFVVASVSYRFAAEAPFPAAVQDVKTALRWLRANATRYGIDSGRVALWGQSAGGHLAALAGVSCGVAGLAPDPRYVPRAANVETVPSTAVGADEASDCVQAVVAWFGIYDFTQLPRPEGQAGGPDAAALFLGCGNAPCASARQQAASPLTYLDRADPPFLLMHGTADTTVPVAQTELFDAALKRAGVPVTRIIVPGVGHSWIGTTPASTREASLDALATSIDFIDRALRPVR